MPYILSDMIDRSILLSSCLVSIDLSKECACTCIIHITFRIFFLKVIFWSKISNWY